MNLMTWAILLLGVFIAVWFFIVVPAEKRHHERKLESLRQRIEKRQARQESGEHIGTTDDERR
jgi:flagellar biosynthesis/type III secretory pathway M-ring protein FliF/YscJ